MQKNKMIFLDVDGTIFDNQLGKIHDSTIDAIKQLYEKNDTYIIIATGRAPNMIEHLNIIKPYISGYVLLNGQHVRLFDEVVYDTPIDSESIHKLREFAASEQVPLGVVGLNRANVTFIDEHVDISFRDYRIKPFTVGEFAYEFDVYQAWLFGQPDLIDRARTIVPNFQFLNWGNHGCDIIIKGTSKAVGVDVLIKKCNIAKEHTYAIGDANNDIEMIQHVTHGIAMGNATTELKNVSRYITKPIHEDGLYYAFQLTGLI
jgi:Cof subfamily protein (haloacid dehalogenase superfamily)